MQLGHTPIKSCIRLLALSVTLIALSACVTTENSVFQAKASEEKALDMRVEIAVRYLQDGDFDQAKKNLFMALEMNPESAKVHEVLGLTYQRSGEQELAEKSFERMLKSDPQYSRGRNNYAVFLFRQQRYKEALRQFEAVVEDIYYEKRASAFANLGLAALEAGELDKAEDALSRAIGMGRSSPHYFIALAEIYYQKGDFARSNRYFEQYRQNVQQSSAKALLLGIKIAEQFDDKDSAASYALALKNLYPRSNEYLLYRQSYEQ